MTDKLKNNPYKYKGPLDPVKDSLVCVPRSNEVEKVIDGIMRGEYWAVFGSRQRGKTTFLRQIAHHIENAYCIYINLQVSPPDVDNFYQWLTEIISGKIPCRPSANNSEDNEYSPQLNFLDFLQGFQPEGDRKRIVFLFDEIDGIPDVKGFLEIWRLVYHERYSRKRLDRYSIVITGSVSIAMRTLGENSPFNIAEEFTLKDFTYEESENLMDESLKALGFEINQKTKERVLTSISGHPQMLQQFCYHLVEISASKLVKHPLSDLAADIALDKLMESNSSLDTLKQDLGNEKLYSLIMRILKGEQIKYYPHKEFSFSGAGSIVKDKSGFCAIRNDIYAKYLSESLGITISLIEESGDDKYFGDDHTALPFALKQFRAKNFYGILDTEITNIPLDTKWIFLTGENGFGKTTLLQALTIGLFGNRDGKFLLTDSDAGSKVAVIVYSNGKTIKNEPWKPGFTKLTNFTAYGPSRLEIQGSESQNSIAEKSSQTYSLFNTDGILLNIEYELLIWYLKKDPRFDIVKKALLHLLPYIADITIDENDTPIYIEKETATPGGVYKPLPFSKLAAGHKSIIAMVGDIMIRFFKQQGAVEPKDLGGIVIIDELDLHLHPKWQRKLPALLSEVFPKIQFIASTHSVIPFLGAPEKSVFLKVNRNTEDGIKIETVDIIDIKNLLPNSILTSPIFDLEGEEIMHIDNQSIDDVNTEDNYKDIVEKKEIIKRMKAFKEKDMDFPDELFQPGPGEPGAR